MMREVAGIQMGGNSNERKARLFILTAGRRLWEQLDAEVFRRAIEVAWRLTEGTATAEEAAQVCEDLRPILEEASSTDSWEVFHRVRVVYGLFRWPGAAARELITPLPCVAGVQPVRLLTPQETNACCDLLRDIFGDRGHPVSPDPAWLAWNDGTVVKLAKAIYRERRFENFPILADALEEAGCTDPDILGHCRQRKAGHVQGCFVVDALLGWA
jgi:hypothetical protein